MYSEIVSEYDQEIPQSQTADKPMTQGGRATEQSQDTRKRHPLKVYTKDSVQKCRPDEVMHAAIISSLTIGFRSLSILNRHFDLLLVLQTF